MPVGTLLLPDPSDVKYGVQYGAGGTEYTGTFSCSANAFVDALWTPFAEILKRIITQIAYALKISTDWVRPVFTDEYPVTETEDMFAYVRIFTPYPVDPSSGFPQGNQGAGRIAKTVGRTIRVYIWTRSGEDVTGGDEVGLLGVNPSQRATDTTTTMPGHSLAEEIVLNSLDDYIPTDASGSAMTLGPLHWIPSEGGPPTRKAKNGEGMNWSALDFQAVYNLAQASGDPYLNLLMPSGI